MKVLAIETSCIPGSLALLDGDQLLKQTELDADRRTTAALAPSLKELLKAVSWSPADVELVAVSQGPGSFTGLRVGVTTAKTLAYAVGCSVIGVNTLEVIAAQSVSATRHVWAVMDAHRRQVFAARFEHSDGFMTVSVTPRIAEIDDWLRDLQPIETVSGPVLKKLRDRLPSGVHVEDPAHWMPRAESVGSLAIAEYRKGRRDDPWKLAPDYYRPSAAEEKLG